MLEITKTKLAEATIVITSPGDGFVGPNFRIQGTAIIRMHTTEFIRVRGQGQTFEFDSFVTDGFKVDVTVGGTKHKAVVTVSGTKLLWRHDVDGATTGDLKIKARLQGSVTESEAKTQDGETTGSSKTIAVGREKERTVTVDPVPPALTFTPLPLPVGPPYRATFEGTASDEFGLVFVGTRFGGAKNEAQQLQANWASWRAVVEIPDRDHEHAIEISADDLAGNVTNFAHVVPADSSTPFVSVLKPPSNPFLVLFEDGGIEVPVDVLAVSNHTALRVVRFRVNDGPEQDADNGTGGLIWRFTVAIATAGVHLVFITATDVQDKTSTPFELEIRAQVQD